MPHAGRVLCGIDMKRESAPDLNGPGPFIWSRKNHYCKMYGNEGGQNPSYNQQVKSN